MTATTKRVLLAVVVLSLLFGGGLSRDSRVIAAEIKAGDADWARHSRRQGNKAKSAVSSITPERSNQEPVNKLLKEII